MSDGACTVAPSLTLRVTIGWDAAVGHAIVTRYVSEEW
jgi:hypothetical protein